MRTHHPAEDQATASAISLIGRGPPGADGAEDGAYGDDIAGTIQIGEVPSLPFQPSTMSPCAVTRTDEIVGTAGPGQRGIESVAPESASGRQVVPSVETENVTRSPVA